MILKESSAKSDLHPTPPVGGTEGSEYSVATTPPTLWQRQLAFAVIIIACAAYGAMLPFADVPLPRIDNFIPTTLAIIFVTDFVTAVLLFGMFSASGLRPLLVLATGYLFSSLIVIAHALTFPSAFAPTGLLGAGPQSTAWINLSWQFGLALAIATYACLTNGKYTMDANERSAKRAIHWSVAIVIILVCTLTSVATAGHNLLPVLILDNATISLLGHYANGMIALANVLTLLLLWIRGRSALDLWLMVAVFASAGESTLATFFLTARFTLGFYGIRLIAMLVSKVVLVALVAQTINLQASLSIANRNLRRERANRLTRAQAVVAAIAHEVRQPLAAIRANAGAGQRFLNRDEPDIDEAKEAFEEIEGATFRASEVFESFRSLLRGKQEHQPMNLNTLVLEAVELTRKEREHHKITTRMKLTSDLPPMSGNTGQLREVILNLLNNAMEAMAAMENRPRIISVTTARRGSEALIISVEDTGPGIDAEKKSLIFEPFVTTKATGTGLGLAICKMIVEQHGGTLSVASDPDGGARFEMTLPTKRVVSSAEADT